MLIEEIVNRTQIHKGWSGDQKYCAVDTSGRKYLLRISSMDQLEAKRLEFEQMKRVAGLEIPMCLPLEFGICGDGVYSLQSWVDGEDLESQLPELSDTLQYAYGQHAGQILKKIHTIPAPIDQLDWEERFNRKMDYKIRKYLECSIHYDNGDAFIMYIQENRHLLKGRPQSYQHGDYHVGNMMLDRDGQLRIIDFNRNDYGDPWEEFNRIVWCAQSSPLFATGMVDGYFDGQVPLEFWRLLALYIASNTLSSIYWAIPFGQAEVDAMLKQGKDVLEWYDQMRNPVPTWYREDFCVQILDGIPFKMKQPYDFSFIHKYGKVFRIFDDQDSGNICFGVERNGERYFIKFAGAPTERGGDAPQAAVDRLRATIPVYQELRHKNLIEFITAEETGGGFAVVFRWSDGECMGRMYPESRKKFLTMPMETRTDVFRDIMDFLANVASRNYLAVDFYDGSIMYDFEKKKTVICDIDFFRKLPAVNDMGRMWGSSRFQAPEEYELGAVLDEVTNVYTLGATAFALFTDYDRSRKSWTLSERRYQAAIKAVSKDREQRQQSIQQFIAEWEME